MHGDYIYLLHHSCENGPEEIKATTDRSLIPDIVQTFNKNKWFERAEFKMETLTDILSKSDDELASSEYGHPLMSGWGGLYFQVVKNIR